MRGKMMMMRLMRRKEKKEERGICEVKMKFDDSNASHQVMSDEYAAYLVPIIAPRAKFHETRLLVEREVSDIDFTRRFEYGWRGPQYFARMVKYGFGHRRDDVLAVGTGTE
ncbi:unnamed protein product [Nesidiocoris tenuis]|uniref:Uncharacterized protein n=1 Tax=Nesidiocoris tenuis TaxID=355587 RepID=A0A6H5G0A0_9HEMI|nr:unnamed protein product [Nesidiocoris tenuis]